MMKKLIPVLAVLAAALIAVSTGAFTSIEAERSAVITVAGDDAALLALAPHSGPNGAYAAYNGAGALYLDFARVAAAGVNVDATTYFADVFTVTNNGTQPVSVTLTWEGDNAWAVLFQAEAAGPAVVVPTCTFDLAVGHTVSISFWIESEGLSMGDEILESITLTATAE